MKLKFKVIEHQGKEYAIISVTTNIVSGVCKVWAQLLGENGQLDYLYMTENKYNQCAEKEFVST